MPPRRLPRTIDEKVADLEERMRRLQANVATTKNVTDYTALDGVPTDLATIGDLQPIADALEGVELLLWLGGPT